MSLLITVGLPRRRLVCSSCGQVKLARAFFRFRKPRLAERAQPCNVCCRDCPVEATVPLVAQALELCANARTARLELPAILLTDALDVLTDPDVPD